MSKKLPSPRRRGQRGDCGDVVAVKNQFKQPYSGPHRRRRAKEEGKRE